MQTSRSHPYQQAIGWTLLATAAPLMWWLQQAATPVGVEPGFLVLAHSALELFSVVVAALVFWTGYRTAVSVQSTAILVLGAGFLGVAWLDFLHTVGHVGMPNVVSAESPQEPLFFWWCARALAAAAMLAYVLLPPAPHASTLRKRWILAAMLAAVALLGAIGLLRPGRLPPLAVGAPGLVPLKAGLEWWVLGMHVIGLSILWKRRRALAGEWVAALGFALALSAVAQVGFTLQGAMDKDAANLFGNLYKAAAYLCLLHATCSEVLRRPADRLALQNVRARQVLSAAPDGVLWVNRSGQILMVNPAMEAMSGYRAEELVGQNVDVFLPPHLRARHGVSLRAYFDDPRARPMGDMDLKLMRRGGQLLPVDISLGYWEDEGTRYAIAYVRDLTERKGYEESLRHRATHDELTGLPNRWLFRLQLDQALAHARRSERRVAALFLDLDDFKNVNDSFGHAAGDRLLVQVAGRLRAALRADDTLARMGGDEFAILLADLESADEAVSVAEKLLAALGKPYQLENHEVLSGGSIGLAFFPDDTQDSDSLLRYADMAMYQAKQSGRGAYACFSPQLDQHAHENMQLHVRLKEAIDLKALRLFYQPQVDVVTGEIVGAEALVRWDDAVLGEVSPARFIPIAETTGLILPLSDWVLETACQQIAAWERAGTPLRIAVNFSAPQFHQGNLPARVRAVLQHAGASAHLLEVEITESIAMEHPALASEQLAALVQLGCTVALDDFGTGYSSLAYLKELPVSVLKIDRTFIKDLSSGFSAEKITRSIVALAHSLDMTLVAEGVETPDQLGYLREQGCEVYQGWLFAKAMSAADLSGLLGVRVIEVPQQERAH